MCVCASVRVFQYLVKRLWMMPLVPVMAFYNYSYIKGG